LPCRPVKVLVRRTKLGARRPVSVRRAKLAPATRPRTAPPRTRAKLRAGNCRQSFTPWLSVGQGLFLALVPGLTEAAIVQVQVYPPVQKPGLSSAAALAASSTLRCCSASQSIESPVLRCAFASALCGLTSPLCKDLHRITPCSAKQGGVGDTQVGFANGQGKLRLIRGFDPGRDELASLLAVGRAQAQLFPCAGIVCVVGLSSSKQSIHGLHGCLSGAEGTSGNRGKQAPRRSGKEMQRISSRD